MPHYFFHIHDFQGVIEDDEGMMLADIDAARQEAKTSLTEITARRVSANQTLKGLHIQIAGADGASLDRVVA